MSFGLQRWGMLAFGALLVLFLALPMASLLLMTPVSALWAGLHHPLVAPALRLSLLTTLVTLGIVSVLGTPLAWVISQARGRAWQTLETVLQLPIVIPPAVVGVSLLLAFGRRGLLASLLPLETGGVSFTTTAVVMAQVFVSAPFYVQAAVSAFRRVEPSLLVVARTLGASPWRVFSRIAVPLALPGLAAGAAMGWARSLGEFGATLMFAGNLEGRTQTLPLAVYTALESDLRAAQALSLILVWVALLLLLSVRILLQRSLAPQAAP